MVWSLIEWSCGLTLKLDCDIEWHSIYYLNLLPHPVLQWHDINTLHAAIGLTIHPYKIVLYHKIPEISQISKPVPDMFVLISMHFSQWFQIQSKQILECWHFWKCCDTFYCCLLTSAGGGMERVNNTQWICKWLYLYMC